jgi:asparagine synthetase B (glutamine-hydrolysing)
MSTRRVVTLVFNGELYNFVALRLEWNPWVGRFGRAATRRWC